MSDTGSPGGEHSPVNALAEAMRLREGGMRAMAEEAVKKSRVRLAFQPVALALDPARTAFYEVLVRVLDPSDRIIPAADFMADVEETETGRLLDCIALERALKQLEREPRLRLSVNLSARSIGFAKWRRVLDRGLKADPTVGERLILEINEESAMLVPEITRAFMMEMQPAGVAFALDDFGAGTTRLGQFPSFPVDIVKIDGKFVRGVAQDPDNQALVRAMHGIATAFDLFTVAEEVESAEDAAVLTEIGIDCLQGYAIAAPSLSPPWTREDPRRRA